MNTTLYIVIIILILIIIYQGNKMRNLYKDLEYISSKIKSINENNTGERVLVVTSNKHLQKFLVSVNKILSKNQKNKALNIRNDERMKKMVSNISHDIKTPLTVILGYAEMLDKMENLNEGEKKRIIGSIRKKGTEVVEIINEFFSLSKIEGGDETPTLEKTNISEECRNAVLSYYDTFEKNGLEFNIDMPEKDVFLYTDKGYLERILTNLISNSYKYGYEGGVVGLILKENKENIDITIWDKGRGIEQENLERVFDRLYTLDDARSKEFQSSGLGLTITKQLVEKLNGKIELTSKVNELTSFKITLPKGN
ncbi:MAG: sensor histidine kinase [Clostridium sp.]